MYYSIINQVAHCDRNDGSWQNGIVAHSHRTGGSFGRRLFIKLNMTIKEAAAYSNIGINRMEELLKQPKCNFVLYVGNKKLVKRKEFEQYISKSVEV